MILKLKLNSGLRSKTSFGTELVKRFVQQNVAEECVHRLSLDICRPLYANGDLKSKWYIRSAPKTGVPVDVEVVDTKPGDRTKPTLVALHGCPGSHLDFSKLIKHFGPDYRLVVPNFPDFSVTKATNHFWHSAKEKAQYVRDILKVLDINQIDCLVAHSSAIFPASYLWLKDAKENEDIAVKSVCLLSSPGPKWFNKKTANKLSWIVNASRIPMVRNYLNEIWSREWTKRLGLVNQIDKYDDLALLLSTYVHSDTETVTDRLLTLKELQIPTLSVFSSKDRLFKDEIFYDLFYILGVEHKDYEIYEEHQEFLVQKARDDNWIKVVNISCGGHYVFSTHSALVHTYIEDLLKKVCK